MILLDSATIILVSIFISLFINYKVIVPRTKSFFIVLFSVSLILLNNLINHFIGFYLYTTLSDFLNFLSLQIIAFYLFECYFKKNNIMFTIFKILSLILITIMSVLLILTGIHLFDSWAMNPITISAILINLFLLAFLILKTVFSFSKDKYFVLIGLVLNMSATISTYIFNKDIMLIGFSLTTLFLYNGIVNNKSYFDINLINYNRIAFKEINQKNMNHNKTLIFIKAYDVPSKYLSLVSKYPTYKYKKNLFIAILPRKKVSKLFSSNITFKVFDDKYTLPHSFYILEQHISYEDFLILATLISKKEEKDEMIVNLNKDNIPIILREHFILNLIDKGFKENNFYFCYQPIYSSLHNGYISCEVLMRLKNGDTNISPDEFIPIAEKYGYERELALLAFKAAINISKIEQLHFIEFNIPVNYLADERIITDFKEIIEAYNISPSKFNIEITESENPKNSKIILQNLKELRELGFKFSMDDFGTGYSNLVNIVENNYELIKIDKSLLWKSFKENNQDSKLILDACINLAQKLNRKIVVEGVETKEMSSYLAEKKIDYFQGYLYSKPLEEKDFISFLSSKTIYNS